MPDAMTAPPPTAAPAAASNDMAQYFPGDATGTSRESMKGVFDGLDKKSRGVGEQGDIPRHPADRKAPEPPPKPEAAKPEGDTDEDDEGMAPEVKPEAKEEPPKQELRPDGKPKRPGDFLREELAKQKKRAEELEAKYKDIEPKYKDAEGKLAKLTEYEQKIALLEKRHQEREDIFRLRAYEESLEYKEKYRQPYEDAYQRGRQKAKSLQVMQEDGTKRPATPADFDAIARIENDEQASETAEQMFGPAGARIITYHRERVMETLEAMRTKVEEARKNGFEHEKQMTEMTKKEYETVKTKFDSVLKDVEAKREWMRPVEGDEAWNKALAKGKEIADKAFIMDRSKLSPEQRAELDASNYARSRMYSTLKLSNKRQAKQIADLTAKLAQFQASEPGAGSGKAEGDSPKVAGSAMDQAMANLEGKAKERQQYY